MFIDFQNTVWARCHIPNKLEKGVLSILRSDGNMEDVAAFLQKHNAWEHTLREDTLEFMDRRNYLDDPTIEVYTSLEEGGCLYANHPHFSPDGLLCCPHCRDTEYVFEKEKTYLSVGEKPYFCSKCLRDF